MEGASNVQCWSLIAIVCLNMPGVAVERKDSRAQESQQAEGIDPGLLQNIRLLYPEVELRRRGGRPFFSAVQEVARVRLRDNTERRVVWVHLTIPAARVDHGRGELLIFEDAADARPMVRRQMHTLPVMRGSEIHLLENRWLRFGADSPLVCLTDEKSLRHFDEQGLGSLTMGLSVWAARIALDAYLHEGLEAFLERAPIRKHRERNVKSLPDRIRRFEIYPSLVEDMRYSGFKYSDAWEATLLVRLTPADEPRKAVVLEIGARASSAGIDSEDVELLLWETRTDEPTDRPAP
jgi:hypothetical protein